MINQAAHTNIKSTTTEDSKVSEKVFQPIEKKKIYFKVLVVEDVIQWSFNE